MISANAKSKRPAHINRLPAIPLIVSDSRLSICMPTDDMATAETASRDPFSDWYDTKTSRYVASSAAACRAVCVPMLKV